MKTNWRYFCKRSASRLLSLLFVTAICMLAACAGEASVLPDAATNDGIRQPEVVYLSPVSAPELWLASPTGSEAVQLTQTGGQVYDYTVARDGRWIAYAAANELGGHDLWLLEPVGGESRLLLDCGKDSCIEASWSADGAYLVFTRRQKGQEVLWIVNRVNGEVTPLSEDDAVPGRSPSWSPDGRWIAFIESQTGRIRILDLEGNGNFRLPTEDGLMGSWSPDGQRMIYLDTADDSLFAGVALYILDLTTQEIEPLELPEFDEVEAMEDAVESEHGLEVGLTPGRVDMSVPVWHPTEELLLLAQRPYFATFSKQLWLVPLAEGAEAVAVTDDHNFAHGAYSWSPDGGQVVYQRFALEMNNAVPQAWVWNRESDEAHLLAEDAALPQWLP